jgi:hypothetical protein
MQLPQAMLLMRADETTDVISDVIALGGAPLTFVAFMLSKAGPFDDASRFDVVLLHGDVGGVFVPVAPDDVDINDASGKRIPALGGLVACLLASAPEVALSWAGTYCGDRSALRFRVRHVGSEGEALAFVGAWVTPLMSERRH